MSRRYPTAELYEERERDFYRNGRSERGYDELDVELRRGGDPRRSAPDFFREDYGRPVAGPLVSRSREEDFSRGPRHARTFDDDARSTRSSRPGGASSVREVERDDITIRTRDGPERRRPREIDTEETDIVIRRRDQSRPRTGEFRETERDDIIFRRGDGPPTGRREVEERDDIRFRGRGRDEEIDFRHSDTRRNGRAVSTERETIRFQERDGRFELTDRETNTRRGGRSQSRERSSITIKGRERSLPPPSRGRGGGELVAREREEFIVRRPRDISPPENPREIIKEEIVIRRKEERAPTPSPSPSPPPPPAPPALEPEIRPPIIQEIITHHRHIDHGVIRARTPTPPPPPSPPTPPPRNEILEIEINRKESQSRGRERDFEEELDIRIRDRSRGGEDLQVKPRRRDMWTEVTKDLVLREAIESMGYSWEENDEYFYVMEYLRYEDVLQLVEISDRIRDKRKSRVRDIEIERKDYRDTRGGYDERFYEHEVSFDSRRGSRYR